MTPVSANAALASRIGAPCNCVVGLKSAFARIFMDGRNGLNSNADAQQPSKTALRGCMACCKKNIPNFQLIDGDKWAAMKVHSSDWIVFSDSPSDIRAFQVDGKLGLDFEYPGDRSGSSVKPSGVKKKYDDTIGLSSTPSMFRDLMILIVPRHGKHAMWNRVRKWNKAAPSPVFLTCCAEEFLTDVMNVPGAYCDVQDVETQTHRQIFKQILG